jgi:hypothetical protein
MKLFCDDLYRELEQGINTLLSEQASDLYYAEKAIPLLLEAIEVLRDRLAHYRFADQAEEIDFFRNVKPMFTAKLVYHAGIYSIERNKPRGGKKALKHYYHQEIGKLEQYFTENREFYGYYGAGQCHLDAIYFIRKNFDFRMLKGFYQLPIDIGFSTSHDALLGTLLGNENLLAFLENKIAGLKPQATTAEIPGKTIWTGNKVDLIELIYALHSEGVFEHGRKSLKEIAALFELMFQTDLGQFHKLFYDMKARKSDRTRFLSGLSARLLARMDEADQ